MQYEHQANTAQLHQLISLDQSGLNSAIMWF